MRVVDGMHRLAAAILRSDETIQVQFFEGDEEQAFVRSVEANVLHGLPLSLQDRQAAARRIMGSFPSWSDRGIAEVTGLAPRTVSSIRRTLPDAARPSTRIGRDGKKRPTDSNEGRRLASTIIENSPQASLREVARRSGISPATVRDVRARIQRGEAPTLKREVTPGAERHEDFKRSKHKAPPSPAEGTVDLNAMLNSLRQDPALRFSNSGRALLRWLAMRVAGSNEWATMTAVVPPHCTYSVAKLARRYSEEWLAFADSLEQQDLSDQDRTRPQRYTE
jgi:transposase-like protein